MNSEDSYDKFRAEVRRRASNLKRPLEVSQPALWAKTIVVEAMAGKHGDCKLVGAGETFGFSEALVNQCIEFAMRYDLECRVEENVIKDAYESGYNAARVEFAQATGLYTEDDLER